MPKVGARPADLRNNLQNLISPAEYLHHVSLSAHLSE
jgi:hypothetical protein